MQHSLVSRDTETLRRAPGVLLPGEVERCQSVTRPGGEQRHLTVIPEEYLV